MSMQQMRYTKESMLFMCKRPCTLYEVAHIPAKLCSSHATYWCDKSQLPAKFIVGGGGGMAEITTTRHFWQENCI
jgi:hypothetical protein